MPGVFTLNKDMTSGRILGPLVVFSVPIVITNILQLLFNAADIVVVGQFVDHVAVAAVGSTSYLVSLVTNLFIGVSLGSSVAVANFLGGRRHEDLPDLVHTTMALGLIFGLLVCVIGVFGSTTFLRWLSTPEDVLPQASLYLKIYFMGAPGLLLYTFGRSILVPTGDTKRPLYYLTIAGVVNVVLNVILVAYFNLGVAGVGIATAASQYLSAYLMTRAVMRLEGPCKFEWKKLRLEKKSTKLVLKLGLPAGIQNSLFSISNVIIQSSVNKLGTLVVAGNAAAVSLESFIFITMNSFSQGCMTFSGHNYGAGKYHRLNKIYASALLCIIVSAAIFGVFGIIFGRWLLGIYIPFSQEAVEFGYIRLFMYMLTYFLCGMQDCTSWMMRGMNMSLYPMITTVIGTCLLRIVWVYAVYNSFADTMPVEQSYKILLYSYPVSWIVTYAALATKYFSTTKKLNFIHNRLT